MQIHLLTSMSLLFHLHLHLHLHHLLLLNLPLSSFFSLMVYVSCVPGVNSIRSLVKTYKSTIKRRFRRKKSSSSTQDNPERHNQTPKEPVEGSKDGRTTSKFQSLRLNTEAYKDKDPMTSRGCFLYRHKSLDSSRLRSMEAQSRNAGKKINNTQSKSRDDSDSVPTTPSSWNNNSSFRSMHPHLQSRNGSFKRNTPIMYSSSSGMLKPPPIEKKLECTLEELCYGCKKKIMITRDVLTDTGGIVQEEELLTINVNPGWKKGTKITFEGKGNERPGAYREVIIFFISEKRHQLFRRDGDNLELTIEIPLLKALTGCTISVPLLGGEQMSLTVDNIIYSGYQKIINGQGMPISKEPGIRGNLRITFFVQFPTHLTDDQRSEIASILQDSC